jgi:predicted ATPase
LPLIGRGRDMATLREHLADLEAGEPTLVGVSGPPSIGKTRLVAEFFSTDPLHGMAVLRGGASQAQGMPPYLPLLQALGEYIAAARRV